jgi:tetratricopeptide (TPR) repeat protein
VKIIPQVLTFVILGALSLWQTQNNVESGEILRAERLYRAGKFKDAVASYQQLVAEHPDSAASYAGLARAYLKVEQVREAHIAAQKAVNFDPSLQSAHVALGEVYFRMGRILESEDEFLVPLRLHVPDARAYLGMSRINTAAFDYRSGYRALVRAHELDAEDPDIRSAWTIRLPRQDRIQSIKAQLQTVDKHQDRQLIARMKHSLAVLEDQDKHPERTCQLVTSVKAATVSLHPLVVMDPEHPLTALDVDINGHHANLALGTEAGNDILINNTVARKSGVQKIISTEIMGLGTENLPEGYTGFVKSIRIGKLEFKNCYVTVAESVSRNSNLRRMDGTLNAGLFSRFLVDINIPQSEMKLTELPSSPPDVGEEINHSESILNPYRDRYVAPEMSDWTPIFHVGDSLMILTRVNDSYPRLFGISSAMERNWISFSAAADASVLVSLESKTSHAVFDVSGFVKDAWLTGPFNLEFAGRSFRQMDDYAVDFTAENDEHGVEISGFLGNELLKRVELRIDYRDGLVRFGPNQQRKP